MSCCVLSNTMKPVERHNPLSSHPPQHHSFSDLELPWTTCTFHYQKTALVLKEVVGLPCATHCTTNHIRIRVLKLGKHFRKQQREGFFFFFPPFSCYVLVYKKIIPIAVLPPSPLPRALFWSQLLEFRGGQCCKCGLFKYLY